MYKETNKKKLGPQEVCQTGKTNINMLHAKELHAYDLPL